MFNYAQLNDNGYCIAESSLCSEVVDSKLIPIDSCNGSYLRRKYDRNHQQWMNEYLEYDTNKELTLDNLQDDLLINLELGSDTNARTMAIGDDSLLLMEMLLTIDEKLTQLLKTNQA